MNCIHNDRNKPDLNPAVKLQLFMPEESNVLAVPNSASLSFRSPTCLRLEFIFSAV